MASASANKLFLCYRRDDSADITGRFYDRLVARFGKSAIFKDVDSIPLGVDFRTHVDATLRQCAVLVVVIGERWLEARDAEGRPRLENPADFVRIEIESGLHCGLAIVPLLVRNAEHPVAERLPESVRELAFRNGAALRSDPHFHSDASFVIERLEHMLEPAKAEPVAPPAPPPPLPPRPVPAPMAKAAPLIESWWFFLTLWVAATALAYCPANIFYTKIYNSMVSNAGVVLGGPLAWQITAVPATICGLLIALAQWPVLHLRFRWLAALWVPATVLAFAFGDILGSRIGDALHPPAQIQEEAVAPAAAPPAAEAAPAEAPTPKISKDESENRALNAALAYALCLGVVVGVAQWFILQLWMDRAAAWVMATLFAHLVLALLLRPAMMDWSGSSTSESMVVQGARGLIQGLLLGVITGVAFVGVLQPRGRS